MRQLVPSLSLRAEVYRAIRAAIVTGEIVPGEIYSAPSLGKRLGVSATPVREAMLDLATDGLVEPVRNRGFRILVIDDHDLDEILELRLLVEPPSVGRVAGSLSSEQIDALRRSVEEFEHAAEVKDLAAYLAADDAFHRGLLEPLGNRRLVEVIVRLRHQLRLYGLPGVVDSPEFFSTTPDHRAILEAVLQGDGPRAEELMRRHLRDTRGAWREWHSETHERVLPALAFDRPSL